MQAHTEPSNTAKSTPQTLVAVGVVHNEAGQVLYAQRPQGKAYAGWWEFPGGKIEANETLAMALARELREELGIQITDCHHWLSQQFVYPHAHVNLKFCHVRGFKGEPKSLENQAFAWGTLEKPPLPFLPAALPVLKSMQLPSVLRVTAAHELGFDAWHSGLNRLSQFDASAQDPANQCLIVQEPTDSAAAAVFDACITWKSQYPQARKVLISSQHDKRLWGLADGVYLELQDLLTLKHRPSVEWLLAHTNDASSLKLAAQLGCDAATFSPHHETSATNPGEPGTSLSWGALGDLFQDTQIAVYPVTERGDLDLPLAHAAGAAGICLKRGAWPT